MSTAPYRLQNRPLTDARPLIGMHGERLDWIGPRSQLYHLGNGVRSYAPTMQSFLSMDPFSPFSAGGTNAYGFCGNDPINHSDPSGFLSEWATNVLWLGALNIFLSILSFGLAAGVLAGLAYVMAASSMLLGVGSGLTGILSAAFEDRVPELSRLLGLISVGLGIGAGLTAVGATAAGKLLATGRIASRNAALTSGDVRIGKMTLQADDYCDVINSHGAPFTTQTSSPVSGGTLGRQLLQAGLERTDKPLRLASCYSAVGGRHASQAQRIANLTGRNTIGYYGRVNSMAQGTVVSGSTQRTLFSPQVGMAATRTAVLNEAGSMLMRPLVFLRNPTAFI